MLSDLQTPGIETIAQKAVLPCHFSIKTSSYTKINEGIIQNDLVAQQKRICKTILIEHAVSRILEICS